MSRRHHAYCSFLKESLDTIHVAVLSYKCIVWYAEYCILCFLLTVRSLQSGSDDMLSQVEVYVSALEVF